MADTTSRAARGAEWMDDRIGVAALAKKQIRKVFPDHWSFMLGEIALWSFVILLLTGTLLTLWFTPSMAETTYLGSFDKLRGLKMSEAYASTLNISFDVRGGLLLRQMHHWAANLFIAAMLVHMMRIMVTGAFRKPREINWMIGGLLLMLGILEGFAGYSLPDDLLSGTGLRIAEGLMQSIPVVGTYLAFFMFGGAFPGDQIIPRLYAAHVLLIPGLLVALIGAHMTILVYQKHTQWPGPGRTNRNVVGDPLLPVYAAKAGGFFFMVFGLTALMGGLLAINPVWKYGPYEPAQVTADSQPDWYMGVPEGLLRIMPGWETHAFGHTLSWNVLVPGVIMPGVIFTCFMLYPFLERWITGDTGEHHLLQRPRNAPNRTAFLAAFVTLYGLLWANGGNDVIALVFHLDMVHITLFTRLAVFVGPVVAFLVARRWCIALQRSDRERLEHGAESGVIRRDPGGGYSEPHLPLTRDTAITLAARDRQPVMEPPTPGGIEDHKARTIRVWRLRARLSRFWFGDDVPAPRSDEVHALGGDGEGGDGLGDRAPADGHQFDGRTEVDSQQLRAP